MDSIRDYFLDDICLAVVGLALFFGGLVGAVSWNDHLYPHVPVVTPRMTQQQVDAVFEKYSREVERVGQAAVVSFVWAVPMTITGFLGAVICLGVVAHRNKWFS